MSVLATAVIAGKVEIVKRLLQHQFINVNEISDHMVYYVDTCGAFI